MADGIDGLAHLLQIGPAARADRQVRFELGLLANGRLFSRYSVTSSTSSLQLRSFE